MATTITYFIKPRQRKDGTFGVYIRVTHNRILKYINTSLYVTRAQISRDGTTIKDATIQNIINTKVMDMRLALAAIEEAEYMSADQLINALLNQTSKKNNFRLDVFAFAETLYPGMEAKTAEGYRTSLNAVKRFIGGDRLDINDITKAWVLRFRSFLENEPPVTAGKGTTYRQKSRGSRAVSYYMGCLRHLHNMARQAFNDDDAGIVSIPRQPFSGGVIPKMPLTEHRVLSIAQIRSIFESQPKPGSRAELARDVFMLSFSMAGTNTIDLYELKHNQVNGDLVTYRRAKTDSTRRDHAEITLKVLPEAQAIIDRHLSSQGPYLLDFADRYSNSHEFNRACNKGLKALAEQLGIDENLQTYHARHSWATIARNIVGIDFDTVNAGLNHARTGSDRIADIYIARDYTAIWKAQEAVMNEIAKAAKSENVPISAAI